MQVVITEQSAADLIGVAKSTLMKKRLYHSYPGTIWNTLKFTKINGTIVYDKQSVLNFRNRYGDGNERRINQEARAAHLSSIARRAHRRSA